MIGAVGRMSMVAPDDRLMVVVIVGAMLLIVGFAALMLYLRDPWRIWRDVPNWVQKRGELKAQRIALGYRMLWLTAAGIGSVRYAFQTPNRALVAILSVVPVIALYLLWGDVKLFRAFSREIESLNRENQRGSDPPSTPFA
jgi:hypothetical protein